MILWIFFISGHVVHENEKSTFLRNDVFFGSFSSHLQEINVDGELFLKYETVLMDGMPFLQTNIAGWKVEAE